MQIGPYTLPNSLILAPMAGVTDLPFRRLCTRFGAGYAVAEMVTADPYRYVRSQWYADQGFVVVSLDGRGTPDRGRDWERVVRGDLITVPLADQIEGLQALAALNPDLDLSRVGVFGWSFGGQHMACTIHDDAFTVNQTISHCHAKFYRCHPVRPG